MIKEPHNKIIKTNAAKTASTKQATQVHQKTLKKSKHQHAWRLRKLKPKFAATVILAVGGRENYEQ